MSSTLLSGKLRERMSKRMNRKRKMERKRLVDTELSFGREKVSALLQPQMIGLVFFFCDCSLLSRPERRGWRGG